MIMKKQLLLLVMILLPMVASADPVEIDGIYYNLISKTQNAEVTSNPNGYTGTIVIPESDMIINSGDSIADLRVNPANRDLTYVVSWDRPIKDVGTYTLTVKILKGNNELQRASTTFEVLPKDINANDVIADDIDDQYYTGVALKPDFRLEYNEEVLTIFNFTAGGADDARNGCC